MLYVRLDALTDADGARVGVWSEQGRKLPAYPADDALDTVSRSGLSRARVLLNVASDEAEEARKLAHARASVRAPARIDWSFLRDDIAQAVARGPKRPR